MLGTWINISTVILGSLIGFFLRRHIKANFASVLTPTIGLVTIILGFQMALKVDSIASTLALLLSLVLGVLAGEALKIDDFFQSLGLRLERKFSFQNQELTAGFLTASLLFCSGPMTILGALQDGLRGDFQLLLLKSVMDGFSSIFLTSSLGIGVIFSVLVILIYQGGISLLAEVLSPILSESVILSLTVVGGALIILLGIDLMNLKKIKVANYLPAIILGPIFQVLLDKVL